MASASETKGMKCKSELTWKLKPKLNQLMVTTPLEKGGVVITMVITPIKVVKAVKDLEEVTARLTLKEVRTRDIRDTTNMFMVQDRIPNPKFVMDVVMTPISKKQKRRKTRPLKFALVRWTVPSLNILTTIIVPRVGNIVNP